MLAISQRAALLRASAKNLLQGRVSFSPEPTPAQYRFLVFVLAHHGPDTTAFRPTAMPLDFVLGPLLVGAPREALEAGVRGLFGAGSPLLRVEEVDAAGQLVKRGDWAMMPLLSSLEYTYGQPHLVGRMNDSLIDYLPQLLGLLPLEVLEGLPLAHRPQRLAA
jgi:hypothetical protein